MRTSVKFVGIAGAVLLSCMLARAQEAAGGDQRIPFDVRKTGTINVVKDKDGNVSAIRLIVTSYEITLDEAAKPLEVMDGYKVRIAGAFSFDEQNRRWITVKNVETIAAAKTEEAAAEAAPASEEAAPQQEPAKADEAAPAAKADEATPAAKPDEAAPAANEAPAAPAAEAPAQ
ncbi:MAG: hypothetical protein ACOYCD_02945 [Kiritimatiellia bacterium]